MALIIAGVLELSYRRAEQRNPRGLVATAIGVVVAGAGFYGLLNSDGVAKNTVNSLILAGGILAAVLGWAMWRFPPLGRRGKVTFEHGVGRLTLLGLLAVGVAVVLAAMANPESENPVGLLVSDGFSRSLFAIGLGIAGILAIVVAAGKLPVWSPLAGIIVCAVPAVGYLMTRQGARAVIFVALALAGIIALLVAGVKAADTSASAGLVVELLTAAVLAALAFFIRSESTSAKFRTELFTVMLLIALALACSALLGYLFEPRTGTDAAADVLGQRAVDRRDLVGGRRHGDPDALHDVGREGDGERGDPLPHLDPVVHPLRRLRHVAAAAHPVRQLDLRRRREQGGGAGRGRAGGTHEDDAVHDRVGGRRGCPACSSPSA